MYQTIRIIIADDHELMRKSLPILLKKQDEIEISEKLCNEYFPNAFTPNMDGRNDFFKILNASNLKDYILAIYDRWGQKIFETKNYSKGWDGTLNNKPQQSGAYVFDCSYKKNNIPIKTKGTLILIG